MRHPLFKGEEAPPAPTLPHELEYLWTLFCELTRGRQCGMAVGPLSSVEILAWQTRYRVEFDPWEHDLIDRIDALYVTQHNKKVD